MNADSVRLSDLSLGGWAGIAVALAGVGVAGERLLSYALGTGAEPMNGLLLGGVMVLFGLIIAYQNAVPEFEGVCEQCGTNIRAHSSRDGVSEVVRVEGTGTPRRAKVGPISFNVTRQHNEWAYCSGECAADHGRYFLDEWDAQSVDASEVDSA